METCGVTVVCLLSLPPPEDTTTNLSGQEACPISRKSEPIRDQIKLVQ